jgi:hypothetical protein
MGDFFQYPPQDRFGNYFTTYKINKLKDDLNQNGFGDSDDLFEDVIREDFEWTKNIKASLKPGETYRVKNHNGTWTHKVYCGKGETDHPNTGEMIMGHRFRDLNSHSDKCNEWWSEQSLIDKIENDLIHEYDPNWSILNDINFGSLDDIDGRNFAIYFENGVDIDETTELQKKLFDMGYHFPGRGGEFKPVTKKDNEGKRIILFECYNWDTTNERYRQMPPDFRDRGVMLMVADNPDSFFRDDQELSRQYTLSTVIDHDAVVVNGYDYLNGVINESDDFGWVQDVPEADEYRYFEINVCWESWYDEDEGGDVCDNGGSYFIKIPTIVVPNIWDHESKDEYMTGPGDEGSEVIDWSVNNGLMEEVDYDYVEYVREMPKEEYCQAWGNYQEGDKELCKGYIKESEEEFQWIQDVPEADEYRFFDMYVCGDNQYDEETGEDECLDGGSYFLRIPKKEVEGIWKLVIWLDLVMKVLELLNGVLKMVSLTLMSFHTLSMLWKYLRKNSVGKVGVFIRIPVVISLTSLMILIGLKKIYHHSILWSGKTIH